MQPYFFPYLGYFQMLSAVDKFIVYDDVNYIKNGWINRNNILLNGNKHLITLPLLEASPFKLINEIQITDKQAQKDKLLKTIYHAYSKAPYFNDIYEIVEKTINHESQNIAQAITFSFNEIKKYLDLKTEILISSSISKNNSLKAEQKVIDIVKNLEGDIYINAIGGMELYSKEHFKKEGIELYFIKMNDVSYKQFKNNFVPNLSMIDTLMFNSINDTKQLLNNYELV